MTRKLAFVVLAVFALNLAVWAQAAAPGASAAPAPATPPPAVAPTAPVVASTPAGNGVMKIGVINIQGAILATNEGQRDFQALEKKFEPRRAELQKANADVEELTKKLQTQGDKLNEQTRGDMTRDLENKRKVFQRNYEDAQADWNNQQNEVVNRIGSKLLQVMDKYAGENGYSIVLNSAASGEGIPTVLWSNQTSDITKAVVDAYNAQSNIPAPTASTPAKAPAAKTTTPATKPAAPATTAPAKKP
jgi:outer membrane protein